MKIALKHQLMNWLRLTKRFVAAFYLLNRNKLLGRTYVSHPRRRLFIEPVSFCNLSCKFCSYPKNLHPRTVMDDALFRHSVDQAAAMGFETLVLTPVNGDVFMDKNIIRRMEYIENSPVRFQEFYTNFIGADEAAITSLLAMKKLRYMEISVYGHDLESFRNITGRGNAQFRRLISNLTALERYFSTARPELRIVIGLRTYRSFLFDAAPGNDLLDIIEKLRLAGVEIGLSSQVDNWGGDVTATDIADIEMDLTDGQYLYRKGACTRPFDSVQITAEGKVNACACRDPRGLLTLGSTATQPLAEIVSANNKKWAAIIDDHDAGRFNSVCGACGFYESIYDHRPTLGCGAGDVMTREKYFRRT